MKKEIMILTGAGQIGMAIARRMGYGKKIVVGDLNPESSEAVCRILNEAGFDAVPVEMNLSSRESILNLIAVARKPALYFIFMTILAKSFSFLGRITESGFHRNDSKSRSVRNGCPARRSWEGY